MSTAIADPLEVIFAGAGDDSTNRHNAELAKLQLQHEVLKCTLAAQERFETIRGDFAALLSLVNKIQEIKADKRPSQARKKFLNDLVEQERSLNYLAASLVRVLE
jgi:hypothetical protein